MERGWGLDSSIYIDPEAGGNLALERCEQSREDKRGRWCVVRLGRTTPSDRSRLWGLAHWDCNQSVMGGLTWRLVMTGL